MECSSISYEADTKLILTVLPRDVLEKLGINFSVVHPKDFRE